MHPPGKMAKMTYADDLATSAVAKIFQDIGWHTAHRTALTTMTDMLRDYIRKMSTVAVDFANHNGRSEPTTEDLAMTLKYMNVDVSQLQDYVLNVDSSPLPHKVPFFPVPCKANRAIDNCAPSDEERPEWFVDNRGDLVYFLLIYFLFFHQLRGVDAFIGAQKIPIASRIELSISRTKSRCIGKTKCNIKY